MQTKINSASAVGGLVACIAALLFCGVQTDAQPAPARTSETTNTPAVRNQRLLPGPLHPSLIPGRHYGVGSCAASNCHGGAGTKETVGSEYSIWIQEDMHSQAFTALYNSLSQKISKKLGIGKAYEAQICLNCHAANVSASDLAENHRFTIVDGVGCEACHGSAGEWLERHKQTGWSQLSAAEKSKFGFWNTEDILTRARICAGCHVGSPGRDVNHDMIAAGHPPLTFELSSYHARMPKHWDTVKDRRKNSQALDAKLWAVGQAASAEASVRLLQVRTSGKSPAWPEFAEYDCFACHHELQPKSWRQQQGSAKRRPGTFPWGTWHTSLLPLLAEETPGFDFAEWNKARRSLEGEKGKPFRSHSEITKQAATLTDQLTGWSNSLNEQEFTKERLTNLLLQLTADGQMMSQESWNAAAQVYLAVVAIHLSRTRLSQGETEHPGQDATADQLEQMHLRLQFPQSTRDGVRYDSPRTFDEDDLTAIKNALQEIHRLVESEK